jgi:hypothetical protein
LIKGDAAVWLCQEVPVGGGIAFPHSSGRDGTASCAHLGRRCFELAARSVLDVAFSSFLNADDIFGHHSGLFVDKRGFRDGSNSVMMRRRRLRPVPDAPPKSQEGLDGRSLKQKIIRLIGEPCDAASV